MRRSSFLALVVPVLLASCEQVRYGKEIVFNRYRITSPSMSPALDVGDVVTAHVVDQFQVNQIVVFTPPEKFRYDNEKVKWLFRIVGMAGDSLEMRAGKLFLNGKRYPHKIRTKSSYVVRTSIPFNENRMEGYEHMETGANEYTFFVEPEILNDLKKISIVTEVTHGVMLPDQVDGDLLLKGNNRDNWGPVRVPKKGDRIVLSEISLKYYEHIIAYEGRAGWVAGDTILLEKNYCLLLGDNRHNALDSRYLGYVPEESVAGVVDVD